MKSKWIRYFICNIESIFVLTNHPNIIHKGKDKTEESVKNIAFF